MIAARVIPPHLLRSELPMMDGRRETALIFLLTTLTRCGTPFDLPRGEIDANLQRAIDARRGVFIATPHAMLSMIGVRRLHDAGYKPYVVTSTPEHVILGTDVMAPAISRSQLFLLQIRNRLRAGDVVFACVDRPGPAQHRDSIECATSAGTFYVPTVMFDLALSAGAAIFFNVTTLTAGGDIRYVIVPAGEGNDRSALSVTREFVECVRQHVEAIAERDGRQAVPVPIEAPAQ
jgi:hypothetical protein